MSRRILIQFAVRQELAPFARLFRRSGRQKGLAGYESFTCEVGDFTVMAIAGGMGARAAGSALRAVFTAWSPDMVVMAGVAGALDPDLCIGDLVIATDLVAPPVHWTVPIVPSHRKGVHRGVILSIDRVLVSPADKRHARSEAGGTPLAVEMESAAVARAATEAGVPWAAVRAISDTAADCLPLDFNRFRGRNGDLAVGRVALAAATHPAAIPGLLRLGRHTDIASASVASFLLEWLESGGDTVY